MDWGFGINYESKVAWNIAGILGRHIGVRSVRLLKGPDLEPDPDSVRQLEEAEANGVITEQESEKLWFSDLIVRGTRRGDGERVHIVAEVSFTANENDVNLAADRSDILRKVTGRPVIAVVIASATDKTCLEAATRRGVGTAIYSE